ncbi:hypothetical protein FOZ60_007580 [Perkinsus olseni]|uniref:Uncharacterized protein n=1 Tax=Perkinsus olseni TaxID=32597 RepID=A0A7J6PF46_PEROL|nr:hypothetical protein FOZ60_007580 [Perkinsus olseni]
MQLRPGHGWLFSPAMPPTRRKSKSPARSSNRIAPVSRLREQRPVRYGSMYGITPPNGLDMDSILRTANVKNAELLKRPGIGLSFFAETASRLQDLMDMSDGHLSEECENHVLKPLLAIFTEAEVQNIVQPVGKRESGGQENYVDDESKVAKSVEKLIPALRQFGSSEENVRYLKEATAAFYGLFNLFFEVSRFTAIVMRPEEYAEKCSESVESASLNALKGKGNSSAGVIKYWQDRAVEQCRKRKKEFRSTPQRPRQSHQGTLLSQRHNEKSLKQLNEEVASLRSQIANMTTARAGIDGHEPSLGSDAAHRRGNSRSWLRSSSSHARMRHVSGTIFRP